jgi:hypothetical protein
METIIKVTRHADLARKSITHRHIPYTWTGLFLNARCYSGHSYGWSLLPKWWLGPGTFEPPDSLGNATSLNVL